jgi:hypothetical protein
MRRNVSKLICASVIAGGATITSFVQAGAQQFTPPADSKAALSGIKFSGASATGAKFRTRFMECDQQNTCDGKVLKFGCTKDRNRNTALLDLGGRALFFDGKMGLDADGSPLSASESKTSTDQPETSYRYPMPGSPSVNADRVPFIVVPGGGFENELGVKIGDIAAVVFKGKVTFALVADQGPKCKIGEGSIQLHELVGHKVCLERNSGGDCVKIKNVGVETGAMYFIFKDSNQLIQQGLTPANVNQRLQEQGKKLFDALKSPS